MTPPFAIAWYIDAICIALTPMPCPIGMVPIEDVVQSRPGSTIPLASPGKRSAVCRPNPYRRIHRIRSGLPTIWAISSVPMLDEILRMWRTVMSHGLWGMSSWITLLPKARWSGTLCSTSPGHTTLDVSAAEKVTTLNVEPGSYTVCTAWFRHSFEFLARWALLLS